MSMPVINRSCHPVSMHQAVTDLLESIALQETALSHILNAAGEEMQACIACDGSVSRLFDVNDNIIGLINAVGELECALKGKLQHITDSMCGCLDASECGCSCDCGDAED